MTTKLERMVTYLEELLPVKPYDALICGLMRSCKLTSFHYQNHSFYDYQTWHDGTLL